MAKKNVNVDGVPTPIDIKTAADMVASGSAKTGPGGQLALSDPYGERALGSTFFSGSAIKGTLTLPYAGREDALLSYQLLRLIARRSSIVKPPVDFITRSLSGTPYRIRAVEGMRVPQKAIRQAEELFIQPLAEMGSDTFPDVLSKLLRDQIVLDQGILLKHRTGGGGLEAFEPMDAATFIPREEERSGRLKSWLQRLESGEEQKYPKEDIVNFIINRRTDSLFGEPPLEAAIHEVNAVLQASKSFSQAMNANEIPPGVLFLTGGQNNQAMSRLERQVRRDRGVSNDYALKVIAGVENAKWVTFQRPLREMQVAELLERIERIIFRVFGVDRIAMQSVADVNRSTSEALIMTRHFSLFKPLLDIWANKFTFEILKEIHPGLFVEFIHFARTGMESDLVGVGPTGSVSDEAMQPGPGGGNEGQQSYVRKSLCGGCDGKGHVVYHYNGEADSIECPDCGGRGLGGPVFVSRPNHGRMMIPQGLNRLRGFNRDPVRAWEELATPGMKSKLQQAKELTRRQILSATESVSSREDMIKTGRFIRNKLNDLYEAAHGDASSMAAKSGVSIPKTGLSDARSRVYDLVRFQINQPMTRDGADYERTAINVGDDAAALCDLAERVAGKALADGLAAMD